LPIAYTDIGYGVIAQSKTRYIQRVLEKKYGVLGKVAGRYLEAGFSVEMYHPTRYGPIHFIARGGGMKLAVEVVEKPGFVDVDVVKRLLEKAKLVSARPVLVLYSSKSRFSDDVYRFCKENNIKVRRVKH